MPIFLYSIAHALSRQTLRAWAFLCKQKSNCQRQLLHGVRIALSFNVITFM